MPDWMTHLAGYAFAAAGVYAGIRADLAKLHERASAARDSAAAAHARLDSLLTGGRL